MKNAWKHTIAVIAGLMIGTAVYGQTRHDEKPHGVPGKPSAAPDTPASARVPGRHDERPHGTAKKPNKENKAGKAKADPKKGESNQDQTTAK